MMLIANRNNISVISLRSDLFVVVTGFLGEIYRAVTCH